MIAIASTIHTAPRAPVAGVVPIAERNARRVKFPAPIVLCSIVLVAVDVKVVGSCGMAMSPRVPVDIQTIRLSLKRSNSFGRSLENPGGDSGDRSPLI